VAIAFLVMNLVAGSRRLLWLFLPQFSLTTTGLIAEIIFDNLCNQKQKKNLIQSFASNSTIEVF
jgi:hypothetical protein